ncbi:MAG TPA: VOC family protein [Ilumatobacteraceae bacterium]|nr:VOC family protein [Ilumatobacteraceae bacterium]HUC32782.1 VOC family protein [Ilumatobacteraceae bacterium]
MRSFVALDLHHVSIVVDDLAAARSFYGDALGLHEIDRPDFGFPGAWYEVGAAQLHLIEASEAPPRRPHFALEVDDLDAAVDALRAAGVTVEPFPEVAGAGKQVGVRDPSGNRVELRQAEEGYDA